MPAEIAHLAFLMLSEVEESLYRGGILITDALAKPVEFRCTSPVEPNAVQRTLYGDTLIPHIAIELVGAPLLKTVNASPDIVLIEQDEFLALRKQCDKPVLLARRQGETMQVAEDAEQSLPEELISSPSGKFAPVVLTCHWDFPDDVTECKDGLGWAFANCDLIEPFERVKNALATLHAQGVLTEG